MYSGSKEKGHKPTRQVPLVQKQVSVCIYIHFFMFKLYYYAISDSITNC